MATTGHCIQIYRDNSTGRQRWAVLGPTDCWYFPKRYGKAAARAFCKRLNKWEAAHDPV
jgi:hypothetical protein